MSFDNSIQGLPYKAGAIHLRAKPKPKRADWQRDLDAARGVIYASVLGAGAWAYGYLFFWWLFG